ncbi:hypothetical protein GW17_00018150 [Ensete ventricosum]|nr:hypothetical protein GW17_00018150 [Ensete ventricosum]
MGRSIKDDVGPETFQGSNRSDPPLGFILAHESFILILESAESKVRAEKDSKSHLRPASSLCLRPPRIRRPSIPDRRRFHESHAPPGPATRAGSCGVRFRCLGRYRGAKIHGRVSSQRKQQLSAIDRPCWLLYPARSDIGFREGGEVRRRRFRKREEWRRVLQKRKLFAVVKEGKPGGGGSERSRGGGPRWRGRTRLGWPGAPLAASSKCPRSSLLCRFFLTTLDSLLFVSPQSVLDHFGVAVPFFFSYARNLTKRRKVEMGRKGKWFSVVKSALIPNCCQGDHGNSHGKSKHSGPLPTKEVETTAHDAAQPLPLAPIEGVKLTEKGDEQSKHAYSVVALASAVAAEAAAVAAQAAAEVVCLTTSTTRLVGESREEVAAIKIQTAFRGYLWKGSSRSLTPAFTDPRNPQWGWSWLERWMAARPWENHRISETNDHDSIRSATFSLIGQTMKHRDTSLERTPSAFRKSSRPPSRQSPMTPQSKPRSRKISLSPRGGRRLGDEDARSMASFQSERPRRHSIAGSSARDDESLVSSQSIPSYMASTESARARSRFHSPQSDMADTPGKRSICSVKKRLSFPMADDNSISSPASRIRRYSEPPKVDISPVNKNNE